MTKGRAYEQVLILHSPYQYNEPTFWETSLQWAPRLAVLRRSSTCDDLDQFAGNDGLTGTVEQNLELVDHVSGVCGRVL